MSVTLNFRIVCKYAAHRRSLQAIGIVATSVGRWLAITSLYAMRNCNFNNCQKLTRKGVFLLPTITRSSVKCSLIHFKSSNIGSSHLIRQQIFILGKLLVRVLFLQIYSSFSRWHFSDVIICTHIERWTALSVAHSYIENYDIDYRITVEFSI